MKIKLKQKISLLLTILLLFQSLILPYDQFSQSSVYAQEELDPIKINFQPNTVAAPAGYIPDYGATYGAKNGYTYGWSGDHSDLTVVQDTYQSLELDTYIQFHQGAYWEIELPNGDYDVTVSVGDSAADSINTINVENINYWDNLVLDTGELIQETKRISVNDGRLTVDQGDLGEAQAKINYIEISNINVQAATTDTEAPSTPQNLRFENLTHNQVSLIWDASTDNQTLAGYTVYRDNKLIATVTKDVYYLDIDLMPENTYLYEVAAFDSVDNISAKSEPLQITTATAPGGGVGLKAEYFNGTDFEEFKFSRLDEEIAFDWGGQSPDSSLDKDAFTVRWTGKLEARFTELYTFYTETHGGVRLWVNNQLLIDDWNPKSFAENSGAINLVAGEIYNLTMEYREDGGGAQATLLWSGYSQTKEIIPASQLYPPYMPALPTNINITSTSTTVTLTWDEAAGASGYDVEVDGVIIDNGTNTTYMHNNLIPNTLHTYRVRSKTPEVAGNWSELKTIQTKIAVPSNVQATSSESAITVVWNQVEAALGYEIEVDGAVIDMGTATSYVHSGLMPDTQHTYRVRAIGATGPSDWSTLIIKTVLADIPSNIQITAASTSITISWDGVVDAIGYEIEADGTVIDVGLNTTYVHSGLIPNTQHTYRIRAIKAEGAGEWTEPFVVYTLPQPGNGSGLKGEYFDNEDLTDLKATRIDKEIDFNWINKDPIQEITDDSYSIRWTGQVEARYSEVYTFSAEAHGGIRLWVNNKLLFDDWQAHNMSQMSADVYLEAGKRYDIQIEYRETNGKAMVQLFWESNSQAKEIIPMSQLYPIGVPNNLTSTATETSITLNWNPVSYASGYDIEVDGEIIDNGTSTTFTHANLTPGTAHTYRVRAKAETLIGDWSYSLTETTLLGKTTITSIEATETTIILSWEPVNGAVSYDIEVDGTIINNGNNTIFIHSGLLSGTEHSYRVRAKSKVVTGDWTSYSRKWTLPGIPLNITTSATSNSITLAWDDVRGATGYDIEVYNTIIDVGNTTTFTEGDLNPNTQRTYRVRAKNASGVGEWSLIIAGKTLPAVPQNISGTATDTSITLKWDAVAGATAYDLEVDGILVENIYETTYFHDGLQPNTTHTYRVRSKNNDGTSEWSQPVQVTTLPSVPTNLKASASSNEIVVTWDGVDGATNYEIEVDGVIIDNGLSTTFIHSGLETNTEHIYRVRAKNGEIASFWSEAVTAVTILGTPTNLKATATSTEITLTWDTVLGAVGYEVEADGVIINNGLSTTFTHSGLKPYTQHAYRVRAVGLGGTGDWSNYIYVTTIFGQPENITAAATDTTITLTWDTIPGATSYDVFVDGVIINNGFNTSFEHTGLEPYTWHVYRVRAKTDEIVGEWSEALTVVTLLGTPTNIDVTATTNQIILKWDAVAGATGYEVQINGSIVDSSNNIFVHSDLEANKIYSYRIRAKNEHVYSEWSIWITAATTPAIPENLQATATTTSITVSWDPVDGATGYDLEVDGQVISDIKETNYTHSGLEPNTMHIYRVRAKNFGGESEWSEALEKITIPVVTINVEKDNMFNFVVVAPEKEGVYTRTITVTYNPEEVEILDLSANTPEANLTTGKIEGTNITVTELEPGKIVFYIEDAGKTVVNSIKFISKTNGYSKITYTVE